MWLCFKWFLVGSSSPTLTPPLCWLLTILTPPLCWLLMTPPLHWLLPYDDSSPYWLLPRTDSITPPFWFKHFQFFLFFFICFIHLILTAVMQLAWCMPCFPDHQTFLDLLKSLTFHVSGNCVDMVWYAIVGFHDLSTHYRSFQGRFMGQMTQ